MTKTDKPAESAYDFLKPQIEALLPHFRELFTTLNDEMFWELRRNMHVQNAIEAQFHAHVKKLTQSAQLHWGMREIDLALQKIGVYGISYTSLKKFCKLA